MSKYKWLLIDMDDTLFDFQKSERAAIEETCIEFFGSFSKEMHSTYDVLNKEGWRLFQEAKISIDEVKVNRFVKMIELFGNGAPLSAREISVKYLDNLSQKPFLLDGAEDFLEALSVDGNKISVITNGVRRNQLSRIKLAGVGKYFEQVIISEDVGIAKPHRQFFDFAKQKIGFVSDETLVIGDSLESDIKGGNDYGIETCWFNLYKKENHTNIQPTYETADFIKLYHLIA